MFFWMTSTSRGSVISGWRGSFLKIRLISAPHLLELWGYTAPEYAIRGELSEKADIYSFGVLVLEIILCRKNTDLNLPSEQQYLQTYRREDQEIEQRKGSRGRCTLLLLMNSTCA
ncbi:Cold-responsive protein kinase 1 [Linum perenne]